MSLSASAWTSTEDAEEIAAEELAHVFGGVASRHEGGGDFGQVGGGVDAFGWDGDAVEVGADADVVDAGDSDDVIEVGYEGIERCPSDSCGELAVDLVGGAVGYGEAFGFVPGFHGLLGFFALGACAFQASRHFSSMKAGKKLTMTTPLFLATARSMSSVRLRGA